MLAKNQFSQSLCFLSRITILISFIFIFNSCEDVGVDFNETLPNPIVTSEELKIYGKIIDHVDISAPREIILIKDTTDTHGNSFFRLDYDLLIEDYTKLQKETYNSLTNSTNKRRVFQNLPTTTKQVMLRSKYTGSFYDPKVYGVLIFSEIGLNNSRTQALVFVGQYRGPLNVLAYYVVLEKINNEWTFVKEFGYWIS